MPPDSTPAAPTHNAERTSTRGLRRVVAASMAGTVVEWYEFFLFATAATLVFGQIFFVDSGNPLDGILKAFMIYAVGFIARPLGGIVFGHFGDKYGRKHLLQVSIVMVGVATFLMGCLPTYEQVGYTAALMLVLLRFIQGFAVGGEWGGAVLLVAEHSPSNQRGFWSSWPQAAVPIGNLLATSVLLASAALLPEEQFLSWGWRIGFWLSAVIVIIGYYIRTRITDAPIFQQVQNEVKESKAQAFGVGEVFRRYPRGVFGAMGIRFGENIMYYLVVTFSITYLSTHLGADTSTILLLLFFAHIAHAVVIPYVGRLTDRFGRRPVVAAGAMLGMTWGFIAFPMFDTRNDYIILMAVTLGLLVHALMYAGQPALMAEIFPTRMRYSGVSLGYQVTSIVAGSLAPIIAVALLRAFDSAVPISVYLAAACAVTLFAAIKLRETQGVSLHDVDEADRRRLAVEVSR